MLFRERDLLSTTQISAYLEYAALKFQSIHTVWSVSGRVQLILLPAGLPNTTHALKVKLYRNEHLLLFSGINTHPAKFSLWCLHTRTGHLPKQTQWDCQPHFGSYHPIFSSNQVILACNQTFTTISVPTKSLFFLASANTNLTTHLTLITRSQPTSCAYCDARYCVWSWFFLPCLTVLFSFWWPNQNKAWEVMY